MADILGLCPYYMKDGTDYLVSCINVTADSSDLVQYDGTTWNTISGGGSLPTNARVEMAGFLNYLFIVGATTAASPTWVTTSKLNGTTYTTSGTDLTSSPNARYITVWRDKLWLGNVYIGSTHYPNRIFYSDDVTAGAITWTSTNWIDVDVDDGDVNMGVGVNSDRLLFFKEFSLYRYDENSMIKTDWPGTTAHRTIKNLNGYTFYANRQGIWRFDGVTSKLISGPVKPFFDGMTSSPYNMCAEVDDDNYRLYIGTTVINGTTHEKVWINYSLNLDSFFPYKTQDVALCMSKFVNSSNEERIYFGTDSTRIYKLCDKTDTVYSDQYINASDTGKPIQAEFSTRNLDMGAPEIEKYVNKISIFLDTVQGMNINYSINDDKFKPLKGLKTPISSHDFSATKANWIKFKGTENSKNKPFVFNGIVIKADAEGEF